MSSRTKSTVAAEPAIPAPRGDAEMLLVDGRGGYLLWCADDVPRRRYSGLWVARLPEAAERTMVVAGLHECVTVKDGDPEDAVSLLAAHWAGHDQPAFPAVATRCVGHRPPTRRCEGRLPDGTPFCLERELLLRRAAPDREPALLVRWRNRSGVAVRLLVRPLLGMHAVDLLPPAREGLDGTLLARGASWGVRPVAELPTLWLTADGVAAFVAEPTHYRGFLYATDRDRGYDHLGDRWSPGALDLLIPAGQTAVVAVALGDPLVDPEAAFAAALAEAAAADAEAARRAPGEAWLARLDRGASDFGYEARGGRRGVLAGFPWFGEWGRDVFLALPGLTLARGDLDGCATVLQGALPFLRGGLLPNIYGREVADSHYGSCDAALWFALAVQRFADAGGDQRLIDTRLVPALASIADAYFAGAELGMKVDDLGLLDAGRADLNATWMDARTSRGPVTPRQGQPVEIEALWCALLAFLVERGETGYAAAKKRADRAFLARFWLADEKRLADRWCDGVADRALRPNMVLAAALPRSPLSRVQRAGVVAAAERDLLTPRGLRTLSPHDPAYEPRYGGGCDARDAAYHQGTVWPWLSGCYVEAALRATTKARRPEVVARLREWLAGFAPELDRAGIDHVSEVFDGCVPSDGAPQRPGGTIAQAWNTGELLRAHALLAGRGEP